ncbi:MAG: hypothetical protein JRI52_00095, partial [Deltaproteobacteria bacterium]|nr:hypothetical protein [Deltaproteobacteria bacterium]
MNSAAKTKFLSMIGFVSVVAFLSLTSALYLYNIYNWRNYPDFGYGYRVASGFDVLADITEHGRKAGMQLGDRILRVNDKTFSNFQEFRAAMNRALGDKNTFLMKRGDREVLITLSAVPSGLRKAFSTSGLSFVIGFCYFLIGTLVFLMKPHHRNSWTFLLFAGIFGLLLIFVERVGKMTPFWLETFEIFTYTFTPATFIHLAFSFPEERRTVIKYPYVQLVPYLVSAFLFLCIRSVTPTMGDAPKTWLSFAVVYMVVGVFFFLGSCLQLRLTSSSAIVKLRSRMILLGFAITASLPLADFVINALFQVYIVPSAKYYLPFFIVFPLFIGYSIVKHDLFDFDTIIKRTYGYVLTTGIIAGIYGLLVLVSNVAFGRFEITKSPLFPLVFVLAVVFFFNP